MEDVGVSGEVSGPLVESVHIGRPQPVPWAGIGRSAMQKTSVAGPVRVGRLGPEGDESANTKHHGGPEQAVYVFAREDLDFWAEQLDREIPDGHFAENLTTSGLDVNAAEVGERWRIGTAEFEISSVRTPCNVFKNWMGVSGYDDAAWVRRFAAAARPGPYLRVRTPGVIEAGQPIEVTHRPGHGVTVSTMFRALHTDRSLLPELLVVEDLTPRAQAAVRRYLGHSTRTG